MNNQEVWYVTEENYSAMRQKEILPFCENMVGSREHCTK